MIGEAGNPMDVLSGSNLGSVCQVVLYNDNHNTIERVIAALCVIFGHSLPVSAHVAYEAHARGRAIAEVEEVEQAFKHKSMLERAGLTAEVEKV